MDELSLLVSQQQAMLATLKVQKQELVDQLSSEVLDSETLTAYQEKLEQQRTRISKTNATIRK